MKIKLFTPHKQAGNQSLVWTEITWYQLTNQVHK